MIYAYDEHMAASSTTITPLTAPEGTPGEWIPNSVDIDKVDGSGGIRGPIGGLRVPCFVISPYSRGGLMVHDQFDHIAAAIDRLKRFRVPVPSDTLALPVSPAIRRRLQFRGPAGPVATQSGPPGPSRRRTARSACLMWCWVS